MANGLLFALLLWLIGSQAVFVGLGASALTLFGSLGLRRAVAATIALPRGAHLYDLLAIWAPGVQALLLGVFGLWLVRGGEAGGLLYALGAVVFGYELALLILAATEPRQLKAPALEAR